MVSTRIRAVDERVLPFTPDQVWPVVADLGGYAQWWPPTVRLSVLSTGTAAGVGSEVELCPRGGRPFRCRVESAEVPRRLMMRYPGDFIVGTGEWRLDAAVAAAACVAEGAAGTAGAAAAAVGPNGGASTRVVYELDVAATGWLVWVLGWVLPLGRIHSYFMRRVLENLDAEVRRRGPTN